MRRFHLVTLVLAAVALIPLLGCTSQSDSGKRLNGGGSTFIDPIMQEWAYTYKDVAGVVIDYQAKGSGNGIQQMTEKTIQFGCTDAPMKKAQLEKALATGGEVIHIPMIMGPVVPAYNVPEITKPLTFNGAVLADIYLGKIKKWNDPALRALNPGIDLPDRDVSPVYRSEASGTTNIFKEFLAKCSPEFKDKVGVSTEPTWPKGIGTGERENSGVAGRIKSSPGTIGYVELRYAKQSGISYGAVKNRAGKAIVGSPETVTAAAAEAMKVKQVMEPYSLHELTYSLTDAEGENSYPISGLSYSVIYRKQPAGAGQALKAFLNWAVHDGQAIAPKLDYAPLPAELVKKIEARLEQIELQ